MKNSKRNLIIIILLSSVVLYLALKDNFADKIKYLLSFNPVWLIIAFIPMIIYSILKGMALYCYIKKFDSRYTKKKGIHLMICTQFFHAITPFASGGQPYQIYKLKKDGISLGESTNIVLQDFIVYQIALVLLGIVAVVSNHIFNIIPNDSTLKHLVTVGFAINILVIALLFVLAFSKKWNKKIIDGVINILAKLRIIKEKDKLYNKSNEFITNFHGSAEVLLKDKLNFIKVILLNFFALVSQYSVPFFLMMGLGIYINPYYIIITSAYVMLIDSMIPTPGSTGGLEYGFISFFKTFIKDSKLDIIMIVWRMITYYFPMIIGALSLNIKGDEAK